MTLRKTPPPPPKSSESKKESERRQSERFELIAQIEIGVGGEVWLLPVRDISAGGMFIELGPTEVARVQPGDELHVVLDISDADDGLLRLETQAEVVRVLNASADRRSGIGIMWTSADPAASEALARILTRLRS